MKLRSIIEAAGLMFLAATSVVASPVDEVNAEIVDSKGT